jgi:hypothetical protein
MNDPNASGGEYLLKGFNLKQPPPAWQMEKSSGFLPCFRSIYSGVLAAYPLFVHSRPAFLHKNASNQTRSA